MAKTAEEMDKNARQTYLSTRYLTYLNVCNKMIMRAWYGFCNIALDLDGFLVCFDHARSVGSGIICWQCQFIQEAVSYYF